MHNLLKLTKTGHQMDFIPILVLNRHVNNNYETTLSKKIELSFCRYFKISSTTIWMEKTGNKNMLQVYDFEKMLYISKLSKKPCNSFLYTLFSFISFKTDI